MSRTFPTLGGWLGFAGVAGFAAIVLVLHGIQTNYDPRRQLISELALGPHGWAMFPAFVSLAAALFGVGMGLTAVGASPSCRFLLYAAAVAMLFGGVFPMGRATVPHVVAVVAGLVPIVLVAYLLPARAGRLRSLRLLSWLLGGGAVLCLALANFGIPLGVAQRLAVTCILGWLCVLSWRLAFSPEGRPC
ncbi:MAG: DUF998 domain-containing protein [Gemmataceae bacterium]